MASIEGKDIRVNLDHEELSLILKALDKYYDFCPVDEEDDVQRLARDLR